MDNYEKVEKIVEKTGVSYEEAKAALEANNYDLLDTVISLEKNGRIPKGGAAYSTNGSKKEIEVYGNNNDSGKAQGEENGFTKFMKKLWNSKFAVSRYSTQIFEMPVLIFIILIMTGFWICIPLLVVGMFFDYHYQFKGASKINLDMNELCRKATDKCTDIKRNFKNSNNSCGMNGNAGCVQNNGMNGNAGFAQDNGMNGNMGYAQGCGMNGNFENGQNYGMNGNGFNGSGYGMNGNVGGEWGNGSMGYDQNCAMNGNADFGQN